MYVYFPDAREGLGPHLDRVATALPEFYLHLSGYPPVDPAYVADRFRLLTAAGLAGAPWPVRHEKLPQDCHLPPGTQLLRVRDRESLRFFLLLAWALPLGIKRLHVFTPSITEDQRAGGEAMADRVARCVSRELPPLIAHPPSATSLRALETSLCPAWQFVAVQGISPTESGPNQGLAWFFGELPTAPPPRPLHQLPSA